MFNHRPKATFGTLMVVFAILVSACQLGSQSSSPSAPLVVDYAIPPGSLDPIEDCSLEDNGFRSSLYVTLTKHPAVAGIDGTMKLDPTKVEPYLATSWDITDAGSTYTFHLRTDAKFPSGKPVDSAAVKYSIQRALTRQGCGAYFATAGETSIKSIDTPDAATVVFHLAGPAPLFLDSYAESPTGIVDPSLVEANGGVTKDSANKWLANHSAGSGPYLLDSYDSASQAVFVANPTFFGTPALEKRIVVNFITSDSTLLLEARSGKADVTVGLSAASASSLKGNSCCKIVSPPSARWVILTLPNKMAPFNNATFREAITYDVPYDQILSKVAYGYGNLYYGPFPPAMPAYNASLSQPRSLDLTKAKADIAASGVQLPVNIDLLIQEGQSDHQQIATILQATLKDIGVNVTVKQLSSSTYYQQIFAPNKTFMALRNDGPSVLEPSWLLDYDMRCTSSFNTSNFCDPAADVLLNQAEALPVDSPSRQGYWDQITSIWVKDSPRVPLYAAQVPDVLKPSVKHYLTSQSGFDLQFWGT